MSTAHLTLTRYSQNRATDVGSLAATLSRSSGLSIRPATTGGADFPPLDRGGLAHGAATESTWALRPGQMSGAGRGAHPTRAEVVWIVALSAVIGALLLIPTPPL